MPSSHTFRRISTTLLASWIWLFTTGLQPNAAGAGTSAFNGAAALAATRRATAFGERPSGSESIRKLQKWIVSELQPLGGRLSLDAFRALTPKGPVEMENIILEFPGTSGKAVAVTGHYDTKRIAMTNFVGANDGGSSTGFLIEFARALSHVSHADDLYVVFFDGEEAVGEWSETDSCYGSRRLVSKWGADGTLSHIKALINVDMIGDKALDIMNDGNSSQSLRGMVSQVANKLGDGKYFKSDEGGIDDDHMPFVKAGVNALDVIDFDYGPGNKYWHTAEDTMDKLSAHSLQVIGDVILGVIEHLEHGS